MTRGPRPRRVLFVCSGNICRSPMALWIARHRALELGLPLEVDSAGTLGIEGAVADRRAVEVVQELGVAVEPHASKGVTAALLAWADHVLVMELEHAIYLRRTFDVLGEDDVHLLGSFAGTGDIRDPIDAWFKRRFREARDQIDTAIQRYLRAVHEP